MFVLLEQTITNKKSLPLEKQKAFKERVAAE